MKKLVGILLSIVLCLGVMPSLAACGGHKGVTILLMANSSENKFYTKHFEQVAEDLGIEISYSGIASKDYYDKLKAEINGGTTPDIFYLRPSDIRQFVADGLIDSIQSEVSSQSAVDLTQIYDSALSSYRYDRGSKLLGTGDLYALPKDLSVQQLGYNKTLIERKQQAIRAAGIQKLPWEMDWATENYTWEEYKTMAKICTDTSDSAHPVYGSDIPNIEILTWSFGGSLLSDDMQTVTVDSAAVQKAVRYQADLIKDGAANYEGATYDNFVAGKVAFYGETNSFNIKDFDETFASLNMEWDIMPWPAADASKPTEWYGKITSAGFAVSSACKEKENAVNVILTLLNEKTQEKLVAEEKLMLPLYKNVAENAFISSDYDDVYSPKSRSVYIDVISGRNGKFSVDYKCYSDEWRDPFDAYLESIFAAAPKDIDSIVMNAAGYTEMNGKMQAQYDTKKNR